MQIDDSNFDEYFFRASAEYKPKKGQILARWRATADFVDGWVKRNVIELLATNKIGAETSKRIMKNLVSTTEKDSVKVLKEMAQDLVEGLTIEQVAEKPYRFTLEQFYWTKKEYVPDDPHWDTIQIIDLTEKTLQDTI